MSLIQEIHNQRPAVRHALFGLSVLITVVITGYILYSSMQKDIYFATHPDPEDRQTFLARRAETRPQPIAAISKAAGSLMANIGSLIGWDSDAGFDTSDRQDTLEGEVYLLPLSE